MQSSVQKDWESRFTISVEDYLHALISVVNELVRARNMILRHR
jgi:hypothetical protein